MKFNLIIAFIFVFQCILSQEKVYEFKVKLIKKEKAEFQSDFNSFKHNSDFFYEDDNYVVTDSCRGEFGGIVEFKNKKTQKVYVAAATCPLSLININSKYYLTTSLSHMSGAFGFYEISDPTKLTELKENDSEGDKFFKEKSENGLKKLFEGFGGTILLSFQYNDRLYFITSYRDGTYLNVREESKLIQIKKLLDYHIYTYRTGIIITADNHYINDFRTGKGKGIGFIDVKDNVININFYK